MTYLDFHLIFNIPILLILIRYHLVKKTFSTSKLGLFGIFILSIVAFIYTTPWDNYLVASGAWFYPEDRVLGKIGYVPIEEYAFFILQTWIAGLSFFVFFPETKWPTQKLHLGKLVDLKRGKSRWGLLFLLFVCILSIKSFTQGHFPYLNLILMWAIPVYMIQIFFGWRAFNTLLGKIWPLWVGLTCYYSIADSFAIKNQIWGFPKEQLTQLFIHNVPIEEILFFFVTNGMVLLGLGLFLSLNLPRRTTGKTTI